MCVIEDNKANNDAYLNAMIGRGARIGDQMTRDDGVDENEDDEWEEEKEANGGHEKEEGPKCVGLCDAKRRRRLVLHVLLVLGDEQDRTDDVIHETESTLFSISAPRSNS